MGSIIGFVCLYLALFSGIHFKKKELTVIEQHLKLYKIDFIESNGRRFDSYRAHQNVDMTRFSE